MKDRNQWNSTTADHVSERLEAVQVPEQVAQRGGGVLPACTLP